MHSKGIRGSVTSVKLVFFSEDPYFLTQLSDFIVRSQKEIQPVIYSDREKAYDYVIKNFYNVDAILADRSFYSMELPEKLIKIVCSSCTQLDEEDGRHQLNIYQQGEDILRDLKKICLPQGIVATGKVADKQGTIVSFYSIQGGSGQSTIAYQVAAELAQEYHVLYISLDYVNVYQTIYPVAHPIEMAQLMFGSKDKYIAKERFYQSIMRNQHGIYVLPPFQSIGDVAELAEEDMVFLLEQIQALQEFDYVLLDLNRTMDALNRRLLSASTKIISTYTADWIGRQKRQLMQADPYFAKMNFLQKTEFVFTKGMQEALVDSSDIQFPYVQLGADLFRTFYDNRAFKQSCVVLKERIQA